MNQCAICRDLQEKLKTKKISLMEYRQAMISHNNDELKKIQNERLQESHR